MVFLTQRGRKYLSPAVSVLLYKWLSICVLAQGTFETVRTGGVFPTTILRSGITVTDQLPQIRFQFGFATAEEIAPDLFLDSVTASLQAANSLTSVIVLFTADRSGVAWAPNSPGAIDLDESAIQRRPIAFPNPGTTLPHQDSFEVVVDVPAAFRGQPLNLAFDLLDNENGIESIGFLSAVTAVPEPATVAVMSLAAALLFFRKEKR